jgi:hypothetical protein
VGCAGDGTGKITFEESGTIYVVIKGGSWDGNLGEGGIILDNVKLTYESTGPANLVVNGNMSSEVGWVIAGAGAPNLTSVEYTDGGLRFTNGAVTTQSNVLVYQPITLETGKEYTMSADVSGSGATNSWFEIFLGKTVPADGTDYSDGKQKALSTWDGCATSAFEGDIFEVGCAGDGTGTVTVTESGTYYLVIKGGSWDGNLGTEGVLLDNVVLVEKQ